MSAKRSVWITGMVVLQVFYTLMLLALPVYLLALTRTSEIRSGPAAAANISGLKVAAAVLGVPALVGLLAWIGLWKEKLWGWWLTTLTDLALVGILVYSLIDDGWHNIDWAVAGLGAMALVPVICLLLPPVRRFYWDTRMPGTPGTSIGSSLRSE